MFTKVLDSCWSNVALSHDGQWIVTVSLRHHIKVWRVMETMTMTNELIIGNSGWSLVLSCDGSHVVIGCLDRSIVSVLCTYFHIMLPLEHDIM